MAREKVDWESLEAEYRIGVRSLRSIARDYGCTEAAIRKKARVKGWARDLDVKVRTKAQEIIRQEEARIVKAEENKNSSQTESKVKKVRKNELSDQKKYASANLKKAKAAQVVIQKGKK